MLVTEFEQTLSKGGKREEVLQEVLQEKADLAEKEVLRLTQILNKIIEQGKMGEGIVRLKGMYVRIKQAACPVMNHLFCSWL